MSRPRSSCLYTDKEASAFDELGLLYNVIRLFCRVHAMDLTAAARPDLFAVHTLDIGKSVDQSRVSRHSVAQPTQGWRWLLMIRATVCDMNGISCCDAWPGRLQWFRCTTRWGTLDRLNVYQYPTQGSHGRQDLYGARQKI